jgi:hypothetical protein
VQAPPLRHFHLIHHQRRDLVSDHQVAAARLCVRPQAAAVRRFTRLRRAAAARPFARRQVAVHHRHRPSVDRLLRLPLPCRPVVARLLRRIHHLAVASLLRRSHHRVVASRVRPVAVVQELLPAAVGQALPVARQVHQAGRRGERRIAVAAAATRSSYLDRRHVRMIVRQ